MGSGCSLKVEPTVATGQLGVELGKRGTEDN